MKINKHCSIRFSSGGNNQWGCLCLGVFEKYTRNHMDYRCGLRNVERNLRKKWHMAENEHLFFSVSKLGILWAGLNYPAKYKGKEPLPKGFKKIYIKEKFGATIFGIKEVEK